MQDQMPNVNYKFPRLKSNYRHIFRGGDSDSDARNNLQFAINTIAKDSFNPLDKIVYVAHYSSGRFEAHCCYLPRKFELGLTEVEKRRINGVLSKVLFVDNDNSRLERLTEEALKKGFYEVVVAKNAIETLEIINSNIPEILVIRHRLPEKNGLEILGLIRKQGSRVNTIAHGEYNPQIVAAYFSQRNVFYYVADIMSGVDCFGVINAIERTLNGEKPKKLDDFRC